MLVIDEDKRITWDEFFNHKAIRINDILNNYQINDVEDLTGRQTIAYKNI